MLLKASSVNGSPLFRQVPSTIKKISENKIPVIKHDHLNNGAYL